MMKNEITYVKEISIIKHSGESGLMAIKANGIASLRQLIAPALVPRKYTEAPEDGIMELDFTLDEVHNEFIDVELEVEILFRITNVPDWVKGVKINATNNADIELI
jgi:hypothetical protein